MLQKAIKLGVRGFSANINARGLTCYQESKIVPFSMYRFQHVARDVPNYQSFLPFCKKSQISKICYKDAADTKGLFVADLTINLMGIQFSYLSNVLYKPGLVKVYKNENDQIFCNLESNWELEDLGRDKCKVNFSIEFALSNYVYNKSAGIFKNLLAGKMNEAFISRCYEIYGHDQANNNANDFVCQNINCFRERNLITQDEYNSLKELCRIKNHLYDVLMLDNAFGGNKTLENKYISSLRSIIHQSCI